MKNCFQVEADVLYNIGDKLKCKHEFSGETEEQQ